MKAKINVAGKEYPCRVTMGAMVRFKHETGHDVSEMSKTDVGELVLFMWCCVKSACNADKVEFAMDFETFADSLEPDGVSGFYTEVDEAQKKRTVNPVTAK